eukprot:CAMPEP_0196590792 /NCGR_PEP_ID=MMETSP1081-20130531/67570_1 /TAXON_ID=36882 /ORGANISM="Pyramimonas amylifera, Strain CCMP720" /LENGTH=509 /DNA_ID=CAMNT_0041913991 /DNA_START=163 /DNA_END=1692 /DNA_ORIENTATION=+
MTTYYNVKFSNLNTLRSAHSQVYNRFINFSSRASREDGEPNKGQPGSNQTPHEESKTSSQKWQSFEPNWKDARSPENVRTRKIWTNFEEMKEKTVGKTVGGLGILMLLGGSGGLMYNHLLDYLCYDLAFGGLLIGGVLAARHGQSVSKEDGKDGKWFTADEDVKFDFKLLNDEDQYRKETKNLKDLLKMKLPSQVSLKLAAAARQLAQLQQSQYLERHEAVLKRVDAALERDEPLPSLVASLNPKVFVVDFVTTGLKPPKTSRSVVQQFGDTVSLLVALASPHDEVVVRVTSPGGSVVEYGLAASQMVRLKRAGVRTTACVDTVAASGGYMLACVADRMVAAPFAFLGSIGVVAQLFNIHKVLKRNDIDTHLITAGKFKRTLTPFTESTTEAEQKLKDEIQEIHTAFKDHVGAHREVLEDGIEEVATGEVWLALHAKEKGLVDELMTSDEYLRSKMSSCDVILVTPHKKHNPLKDLLANVEGAVSTFTSYALNRFVTSNLNKSDYMKFQ